MTIEVIDTTVPTDSSGHKCTCAESCDIHRAQRWIKSLKREGYPDADLEASYLLLCQQARMTAAAGNTIDLYQGALTALIKRAGGRVVILAEEMIPDEKILNPDVDAHTEAVILKLSSMDEIVAETKASVSPGKLRS
jgi:hypothetical protein